MYACNQPDHSGREPIELPSRSGSPGSGRELSEIQLPAADNASRDIPQEFPEKNNRAV